MGRKIILYDLYKDDEYQGRYKAKELMYLLGMSRETIASRVYHGVKTKDGYEIMRAEPDGWAEAGSGHVHRSGENNTMEVRN